MLLNLDLRRFASEADGGSRLSIFRRGFVDPGIWIVCIFRAQDFFYRSRIPILPWLFFLTNRILFSVEILPGAKIGGGLRIQHGSGIVIGNRAILGNNVTIYHHVTIGSRLSKVDDGWPIIGSNCLLSVGSTILGPIRIWDDVRVGANCLVICDVPSNSTVVGNPGRIIKKC